ncbi:uncharacterized protein LOC126682991 [Mercurialis annua]|uniref:uncharacterized protein LOC126682991 n=1 Tax=Mercurialis annua TaxID=3986 RepID=UPI0021605F36|nr:uncharacterized protein LOC126682991 [Mercurialis annua]
MDTEIIVNAVESPENKRLPPRSRIQVRFKTFLNREVSVRDRGINLYLPPQDLKETCVRVPISNSGRIRSLGKTLLTQTMTTMEIDEDDHREIMGKIADEIRDKGINYISEIGVEYTTATSEECDDDEYLRIKTEYEGQVLEFTEDIVVEEPLVSELEDEDEEGFPMILSSAAAKSCVDALDRINVSADDDVECSVCLEGIEVSEPAIRMPCLHYYHQDCIVKWLCQNHSCPLCRYELPAEL